MSMYAKQFPPQRLLHKITERNYCQDKKPRMAYSGSATFIIIAIVAQSITIVLVSSASLPLSKFKFG